MAKLERQRPRRQRSTWRDLCRLKGLAELLSGMVAELLSRTEEKSYREPPSCNQLPSENSAPSGATAQKKNRSIWSMKHRDLS